MELSSNRYYILFPLLILSMAAPGVLAKVLDESREENVSTTFGSHVAGADAISAFVGMIPATTETDTTLIRHVFPDTAVVEVEFSKEDYQFANGLEVTIQEKRATKQMLPEYATNSVLVGGTFFEITTRDLNGAMISKFEKQARVAIGIPGRLEKVFDPQVYVLDETLHEWRSVPSEYNDSKIRFATERSGTFGIWSGEGISDILPLASADDGNQALVAQGSIDGRVIRKIWWPFVLLVPIFIWSMHRFLLTPRSEEKEE